MTAASMDRRQWQRERERAAAACVAASVDGMSLHEMRESPDADLVHSDGYHVGLEIVRTEDPRPLHLRKRMESCSAALRAALQGAGITGVFQPYYDVATMSESMDRSTKRAWDREVPDRLTQLITTRGAINLDADTLAAHQISGIAWIEAKPAEHTFVGVGWQVSTRKGETLADIALESKHAKLTEYRRKNGDTFREYWLAISGLGAGVMEDGGFSLLRDRRYKTDFDRVFLLWFGAGIAYERAEDVTPPEGTT
ncbi:MAG: hypothetical protein JWP01_3961 [Myxococcales bacterium]|nr:hypothetical protein [Myxococcales bacterium]